jgi:hydroxymethylpyrimidine pyrophosphatase-like HAD family hydrolase
MSLFRALALDYDGTLTTGGPPRAELLAALRAARDEGFTVVLVTGRILDELRAAFPGVDSHFDLLVAENGAVLAVGGRVHALAPPVAPELDAALLAREVSFRRGRVLLATSGDYDRIVLDEMRRSGLDCQLVRNRGELMVLPAGVSKGSGLRRGLAYLGISPHSTLGVGDAENDIALLEACELGVAVGDAVASLKARADVVLSEPNGEGVVALLQGPLLRGGVRVEPRRWQVSLGRTPEGVPVELPASQINVLIAGGSRSGKSFAAGLIAEQLVELGYTVCAFDPEGDHAPLGRLPQVVTLGGMRTLPDLEDLVRVVSQGINSVVVDMSLVAREASDDYVRLAIPILERLREERGVPHWIVVDEAHAPFGPDFPPVPFSDKGHCLVTYRPDQIALAVLEQMDFVLLLAGEHGIDPDVAAAVAAGTKLAPELLAPYLEATNAQENRSARLGLGDGVLFRTDARAEPRHLVLGPRWVEHVRHWHKYLHARLPRERWFYFRDAVSEGKSAAANLAEFHRALRHATAAELRHHAKSADFSRWLAEVIQDETLSAAFRPVEERLRASPAEQEVEFERARRDLLRAIEQRYGT